MFLAQDDDVQGILLFLPSLHEIFWSALSIIIIAFVLYKFGLPPLIKILDERSKKIEGKLEESAQTQAKANKLLEKYELQLSLAEKEASQIKNEAKQNVAKILQEGKARATVQSAQLIANAKASIEAEKRQAFESLKNDVGSLATVLAEKMVVQTLKDNSVQRKLVDDFISSIN